jgi:RHS repeat-associated protein
VFSIGYDFHVGNGATGANNGNVWGITNYKDNSRNQSFTYDSLNRLTSAQNAGTDCTKKTLNLNQTEYWGNNYGYDPWGNLTSKTVTKCSAEHLNAPALVNNQLSGYGYDAAGNMTSDPTDGGIALSYDQENRIQSTAGYTYTYDADGNRVKKINGSTGTLYWYMAPGIVAESDLSGTLKSEYVFFDGERVARRDLVAPGGVFYYFSDHLKTASVITDSLGNIKSESDYYPWGGELQFVANDSNHYKFTGKERDETGLDYFGARYYSNGLGRFITADWAAKATAVPYAEFADPQSLNLYSYVRNNPLSRVDPTGHATCANPPSCTKSTIDAHPAGEKGPTITFQNDDPNGKSPNQPVTTKTAVMVEKAVIKSGVKSVNINSTTGGKHAPTSNHPKGRAVDINKVNGTSVRSQGASPAVKSLQGAFAESPDIRENFGPAMMEKTSTPGSAAQPFGNSKLTEDHEGHIHESSQP